jgi:hypothetical protein
MSAALFAQNRDQMLAQTMTPILPADQNMSGPVETKINLGGSFAAASSDPKNNVAPVMAASNDTNFNNQAKLELAASANAVGEGLKSSEQKIPVQQPKGALNETIGGIFGIVKEVGQQLGGNKPGNDEDLDNKPKAPVPAMQFSMPSPSSGGGMG